LIADSNHNKSSKPKHKNAEANDCFGVLGEYGFAKAKTYQLRVKKKRPPNLKFITNKITPFLKWAGERNISYEFKA
jgi:hypothetical protein